MPCWGPPLASAAYRNRRRARRAPGIWLHGLVKLQDAKPRFQKPEPLKAKRLRSRRPGVVPPDLFSCSGPGLSGLAPKPRQPPLRSLQPQAIPA